MITRSTIELSLGESRLTKTIDVVHDVPLIGAAEDRFERVEGYVRQWRPMKLGRLHLVPGAGTLRMRATEVAGQEVGEMRLLMFRKL